MHNFVLIDALIEENYRLLFGSDSEPDDPFSPSSDEYQPSGEESIDDEQSEDDITRATGIRIVEQMSNVDSEAGEPVQLENTAEENPSTQKNSRKRKRRPETWKRKKAAKCRERGEEYISYKGTLVPAKKVNTGILCSEKCPLKCSEKISIEERHTLFKSFYSMDVNSKNVFLFKSIVIQNVKRFRADAQKHKTASFKYKIFLDRTEKFVCKRAICAIFAIGRKKLQLIQEKIKKGACSPSADARGKHDNRPNRIPFEVVEFVKWHIGQFPSEESHYSRHNNPNRRYLSPELSVKIMHELYLKECTNQEKPEIYRIKIEMYRVIFVENFNLGFGAPKSDTCSTCDKGDPEPMHKENYEFAFTMMEKDRKMPENNAQTIYITYDLQQTMPLPKLSTGKAWYLRQLWFYNLGIHAISKEKGNHSIMCNWTENVAGRGSSEIISCLWQYIQTEPSLQNIDHLLIWTDSCGGQNKNFNVIAFYQYLILTKKFVLIDHKFPEVGHSFLDSDRDFGRIEKRKRKAGNVYLPEEYRTLIQTSLGRKCRIINMDNTFYNDEHLIEDLNLMKKKKNTLKENVNFRDDVKWIRVEEYGSFLYKTCLDPYTPFLKVDIQKNKRREPKNVTSLLPILKNKHRAISTPKIEDIKVQLPYIPEYCKYFYENIINCA